MVISSRKLFRLDIHRLLLAAERTVAHDAFAHNMGGNFDRALSCGEGFKIGRRGLGRVRDLQVERAQGNEREQREGKREGRRPAVEDAHPRGGNCECNQPHVRCAPGEITGENARRKGGGGDKQGFPAAAIDKRGRTRGRMRSIRGKGGG